MPKFAETDTDMCGFAFLFDPNSAPEARHARVDAAITALRHRGPDEQRVESGEDYAIGHARLSIIDLSASHQPMRSPDGRYVLAYNGEIYNYADLRRALEPHWSFLTHGDTEVLLAGLCLHGTDFLAKLEGMWAFALWDTRERSALLCRDRMGKKPLYYAARGDRLLCASELPALRPLDERPWEQDADGLADYFRYGYCLPGHTTWQDVKEVLPGHWLRWKPARDIRQQAYWQLPPPPGDGREIDDDTLRATLTDAVRKRLVADVEVGAFLSGGIDSSLVCALAQPLMDRPLKTYTIGFSDPAFDESPHAAAVARSLGTDHHTATLKAWDEARLETLLTDHIGQPFADSSILPTALLSELAARDVKVALSGDGADEFFGGYQRYQARAILRWYTRLPQGLRALAERALLALPEPTVHHSRSLLKKAHLFVDVARRMDAETPYTAPLMFHPQAYARLLPELSGRGYAAAGLPEQCELDDLSRMLHADALAYLPQDILVKVDRASMAHGLETRAPFLDHKLIELAVTRRASRHLRPGRGKRWLRSAFAGHLPPDTWKRRKQGFAVPVHQWFRGGLGERLEAALTYHDGFIDSREALALLAEHRSGRRDHGYRLWMLHASLATFSA